MDIKKLTVDSKLIARGNPSKVAVIVRHLEPKETGNKFQQWELSTGVTLNYAELDARYKLTGSNRGRKKKKVE